MKTHTIGNTETGHYYWVGHCKNDVDYYIGQTFKTIGAGKLKSIKLFPTLVYGNTEAHLSIFEFDQTSHSWQQQKGSVKTTITKGMEGNWVNFALDNISVEANKQYAFKLSCNSGGMMAVAECPWHMQDPYNGGEEWVGSSINPIGIFHKNFDVAFLAEVEE